MNISASALASLVEYDDYAVGEHLERMPRYVEILLDHCHEVLEISIEEKERIVLASVLHDAGKSMVPAAILGKPSRLTEEEFDKVKMHTVAAAEVFARAIDMCGEIGAERGCMAFAMDIALYHHEKWNGTGYPRRLKGEEIPFSARIIAIADVYDALTSRRPYKRAWTHDEAFRTIVDDSGQHFDPALVEVFKRCADKFRTVAEEA